MSIYVAPGASYEASASNFATGLTGTIGVRVTDGVPTLLINGEDVVVPIGVEMPPMPGSLDVGFGAGIAVNRTAWTGQPFVVHVLEVRGYQR